MKVHVICCNDSIESAVLGSESEAIKKLQELKQEHWARSKPQFSADGFENAFFWHIHTVDLVIVPGLEEIIMRFLESQGPLVLLNQVIDYPLFSESIAVAIRDSTR